MRIRQYNVGERLRASDINKAFAEIARLNHVTAAPPLEAVKTGAGVNLRFTSLEFWAVITGGDSSNGYSFSEVAPTSNGNWQIVTNGRIGSTAFESNGKSVNQGSIVWLRPGVDGGYLFSKCCADGISSVSGLSSLSSFCAGTGFTGSFNVVTSTECTQAGWVLTERLLTFCNGILTSIGDGNQSFCDTCPILLEDCSSLSSTTGGGTTTVSCSGTDYELPTIMTANISGCSCFGGDVTLNLQNDPESSEQWVWNTHTYYGGNPPGDIISCCTAGSPGIGQDTLQLSFSICNTATCVTPVPHMELCVYMVCFVTTGQSTCVCAEADAVLDPFYAQFNYPNGLDFQDGHDCTSQVTITLTE